MTFVIGAVSLILGSGPESTAQESSKWSVPVRVFAAPASTTVPTPTGTISPDPATASTGLPPQYQTTRRTRAAGEPQADDATLRFLVPLVERPILVEARVTVDGQPFRMLREVRIDKLLKELAESAPAAAAPVTTSAGTGETDATPAVAPGSPPKLDNSILARLVRYTEATKRPPSREEARWLLTNWVDGPTLLLLDENYQRVRANTSPLFTVLDRDEDGVISAGEIGSSEESLWKYDANQDQVLSLAEITKAAERTPAATDTRAVIPPLIPLEQIVNPHTFRRLCENYTEKSPWPRFDRDGDEVVSESELAELQKATPDLIVQVSFDTKDAGRSRLDVVENNSASSKSKPTLRDTSITLLNGRTWLELSAVQSQNMSDADQISLGAVRDGFPMLPEMDVNEDGRLTIRELRQVSQRLASFDHDNDGAIPKAEILPTLRVSFGLGPIVHRQLVTVRSVHPVIQPANITPPEWFTRMDRNQDGDLTPREFLGGKGQFASLDADQDELISITEAAAGKE